MNERYKELLVQSGLLDYTKIIVPEHEKFAELIVRECASVVERDMDRAEPIWCSDKILKHFGVE